MGLEHALRDSALTSRLDDAINWARKYSFFLYPYVTACCGMEFMSVAGPRYDLDRFGAAYPRFSPRQSDLLMVVGTITHRQAPFLKKVYDQMCEPKWVMSFGACTCSGGPYDNYATLQGIDRIIPVDIYVPGCPPPTGSRPRRPDQAPGQGPARASPGRGPTPRRRDAVVSDVTFTLDGREITVPKGTTILQAALDHGVEVPHYCYHPKLEIDGSCRMCLVEVEKAPKLQISCNTPVADGMVVRTDSEAVLEARRGVMELLLVNHPLDCPICDQAGECRLQDYAFEHGQGFARTDDIRRKGPKRVAIGPRVVFDQERCILCRRCVRFCRDVTGTRELGVFHMGDRSVVGTYPEIPLDNAYSINTADICPVGALLSSDFHHKLRVWFLEDVPGICTSCSRACNVDHGVHRDRIWRIVPRRNDHVNDTWMCDHGRLDHHGIRDEGRLREPAVRTDGTSEPVEWDEALTRLDGWIRSAIDDAGPRSVALVASARLTNEEAFLLQRLAARWGLERICVPIPTGDGDDLLIRPEKVPNARGLAEVGLVETDGPADLAAAARAGELRVLYVVGRDAAEVDGGDDLLEALGSVGRVIVHDTARSRFSDRAALVLPGRAPVEKDGTFTNFEGRVQRMRGAVGAPGGIPSEGEVFARLLGEGAGGDAATVLEALAGAVPSFAGMSWDAVGDLGRSLADGES